MIWSIFIRFLLEHHQILVLMKCVGAKAKGLGQKKIHVKKWKVFHKMFMVTLRKSVLVWIIVFLQM
jgi:hypothetical protein